MKNKQLIEMYKTLKGINVKGVKFNYAISRNIILIENLIKSLEASVKPSPEFATYEKARVELAKSHAKKDEKKRPMIVDNQYDIEDQEYFDAELKALQETHQEAISERAKQMEDYLKLLEEETTVELFKVSQDLLPEDLTTQQVTGIMDIVE